MLTYGCERQGSDLRPRGVVAAVVLMGLVGSGTLARAQVGGGIAVGDDRIGRLARVASGSIEGMVVDQAGQPLLGATVSALGYTSASAVTDARGRFAIRLLPSGAYVVRAHRAGFVPSRRQMADVRPNGYSRHTFALQREMVRTASLGVGVDGAQPAQPLMTAALGAPGAGGAFAPVAPASDDHSETAWRLRHLARSILKDTTERVTLGEPTAEPPAPQWGMPSAQTGFGRFLESTARAAANFFSEYPMSGEVNLFASGLLGDPLAMFSPENLGNGVAFVSLRGPAAGHGDWTATLVRAQADVSSWFVSGAYRTRPPGRHVFDVGASYSLLRFSANPSAGARDFWSRSAGTVYGVDRWTLTPYLTVTYGGSLSTYDYLSGASFLSPRASVSVVPLKRLRVQATVARNVLAPGREEFLQPLAENLWVPAGIFMMLGRAPLTPVERVRHYEVSIEQDLSAHHVLTFRTFVQHVADQQSTLFGSWTPFAVAGQTEQQYAVATAGDVSTRGWGVGVSNAITDRVRGSVFYALTESTWAAPRDGEMVAVLALPATRAGTSERLHDLTTQLETEIPGTETRVFVVYKINTGFARRESDAIVRPGLDMRFDVQVTQRLPFLDFTSAQWQVLFAVRNLFRDGGAENSVYDELLVVRPPKRIVGGVVVRF